MIGWMLTPEKFGLPSFINLIWRGLFYLSLGVGGGRGHDDPHNTMIIR